MNDPFQLVTNCTFKGKDYLVQMCVLNSKKLELIITDKLMAEDWQCEYDASYIEALTHKTGNYKQFDVFVMMLKSGLLKTSDCISLDLLTIEDLEQLRCKKIVNSHSSSRTSQTGHLNKRYLILTYTVEFDRIHYPLPLDYCGPPDPTVLQSHIRRLESEIERLKQKNDSLCRSEMEDSKKLKEKIQNLIDDNKLLTNENHRLNKLASRKGSFGKSSQSLQKSLVKLEEQVMHEKNYNQQLIFKLKMENKNLKQQVEEFKKSETLLKAKIRELNRYNTQQIRKSTLRKSVSPEKFLERKNNIPIERLENRRPLTSWNTARSTELKNLRKSRNKFLSSSSFDSDEESQHRPRSREKRPISAKPDLGLRRSPSSRRSSVERSRLSSGESKNSLVTQKPKVLEPKRSSSNEAGKVKKVNAQTESQKTPRSRDSSVSSRNSSKLSRNSRCSNRGSGDYSNLNNLKFSMSDLETRIHALQKLLNEGLNF